MHEYTKAIIAINEIGFSLLYFIIYVLALIVKLLRKKFSFKLIVHVILLVRC